MPRIARPVVKGEPAVYHVICRSALDGFALGDVEKEQFVTLLRELSSVYFVEIFGFSVMDNHAHVLVWVDTGEACSDEEIRRRFRLYYRREESRELLDADLALYREKWASLSEFMKDLKQRFSRWYNHSRRRQGGRGARRGPSADGLGEGPSRQDSPSGGATPMGSLRSSLRFTPVSLRRIASVIR